MDVLKKVWPTPFNIKKNDLSSFLIQLIVFIVVCAVIGWLIGVLASVPVIGLIFKIVGSLFEIYGTVGVILCILRFIGVI